MNIDEIFRRVHENCKQGGCQHSKAELETVKDLYASNFVGSSLVTAELLLAFNEDTVGMLRQILSSFGAACFHMGMFHAKEQKEVDELEKLFKESK